MNMFLSSLFLLDIFSVHESFEEPSHLGPKKDGPLVRFFKKGVIMINHVLQWNLFSIATQLRVLPDLLLQLAHQHPVLSTPVKILAFQPAKGSFLTR